MEEFTQQAAGQSLKAALLRQLNLKNQAAGNLIRQGQVKVNGRRTRENIALSPGDHVAVYLPARLAPALPAPLFAGRRVLALEKPPGLAVCDAPGLTVTALLQRGGYPQARPVHRLDVYTGGVLLFALDGEAEQALGGLIRAHSLQKQYECIVRGRPEPPSARRSAYLVKDAEASRVRVLASPCPGAREIVTGYQLVASDEALSRLKVDLFTGRTHQIRAHLAYLGYPLLGDDLYGDRALNRRSGFSHPLLWAVSLAFPAEVPPALSEVAGLRLVSPARFPAKCPL